MDHETITSREFQEEFGRIKINFEKQSNIVFKLLSTFKNHTITTSMQHSVTSPYLTRLLLRMDYNGYLSKMSEKIESEKNMRLLGEFTQGQSLAQYKKYR